MDDGEVEKGSILIFRDIDRFSRDKLTIIAQDFMGLINAGIQIYTTRKKNLYTFENCNQNIGLIIIAVVEMM